MRRRTKILAVALGTPLSITVARRYPHCRRISEQTFRYRLLPAPWVPVLDFLYEFRWPDDRMLCRLYGRYARVFWHEAIAELNQI